MELLKGVMLLNLILPIISRLILTAVGNGVLGVRLHLAECRVITVGLEHRVVAETPIATRRPDEMAVDAAEQRIEWGEWFLSADPAEARALSRDSAVALMAVVSSPLTFDPSRGALTALLARGALDRIDDADLRTAISAWPGYLDDIEEESDFLVQNMYTIRDRMAELGVISTIVRSDDLPEEAVQDAAALAGRANRTSWVLTDTES